MPPTVAPIEPPTTRGNDAKDWLEAHGLIARVPPIRSSDTKYLDCPFQYYLSRRLGLVPALSYSEVLTRGSWMHTFYEKWIQDPKADLLATIQPILTQRQAELDAILEDRGVGGDRQPFYDRERRDAEVAWAYVSASLDCTVGKTPYTLAQWLRLPHFRLLACEALLTATDPRWPRTPLVAQIDLLVYNEAHDLVHIIDYKSCSEPATQRLATCPFEFQTWHYLNVARLLEQSGILHSTYNLPATARVGSMIHLAIQKPNIVYGTKDATPTLQNSSKRSGLSGLGTLMTSGQWQCQTFDLDTKVERWSTRFLPTELEATEYLEKQVGTKVKVTTDGEPDPRRYRARCLDWLKGVGAYSHLAEEREANNPIDRSETRIEVLDDDTTREYDDLVSQIYHYATESPCPCLFPRSRSGVAGHGQLSPYLPFYVTHPRDWPEVIQTEGFTIAHRD